MGLIPVACPDCNKQHLWFTGNPDQRCEDCVGNIKIPLKPRMDYKITTNKVELNKKQGTKHDTDKPDLSLLPREFLNEVAKAMMHGEKKYGRFNYLGGMAWHRLIAAGLRHLTAFAAGEDLDDESGVSHLGHCAACILMLCVYRNRKLGTDDRDKV
jgi:hypothetical protein